MVDWMQLLSSQRSVDGEGEGGINADSVYGRELVFAGGTVIVRNQQGLLLREFY